MATNYEERLRIPVKGKDVLLYCNDKTSILAHSYQRIVIGGRGPYIEFKFEDFEHPELVVVKKGQEHRLNSPGYYYVWLEHQPTGIKVYHQKAHVGYADYLKGMYYVSPFDLCVKVYDDIVPIIEPLRKSKAPVAERA